MLMPTTVPLKFKAVQLIKLNLAEATRIEWLKIALKSASEIANLKWTETWNDLNQIEPDLNIFTKLIFLCNIILLDQILTESKIKLNLILRLEYNPTGDKKINQMTQFSGLA